METDVYRLISHPLQDPSTLRGGLAIHKKIAGKCRRPFSDPPGDLIDRWEHRDGRGRAPRANGSDIPFSAKRPISRGGKGVNGCKDGSVRWPWRTQERLGLSHNCLIWVVSSYFSPGRELLQAEKCKVVAQ